MGKRVGLIGLGKLGSCIAKAFQQNSSFETFFYEKSEERSLFIQKNFGLKLVENLKDIVHSSDILILCVKPNQLLVLLEEISSFESVTDKIFISTCAGVQVSQIKSCLGGDARVIRVMPNIAVFTGAGMTAMSISDTIAREDLKGIERVFRSMGELVFIDENLFDEFTAICASGPAFLFEVLRAFETFAMSKGFSESDARTMVTQLARGVDALLQSSSNSLDTWIAQVATPDGCTEAGLKKAKETNLEKILHSVLHATSLRSSELSLRDG